MPPQFYTEQKNKNLTSFLNTLRNTISQKKIFISYAWPILEKESPWIKTFVHRLARDLKNAGLDVFLDQHDSGPGYGLHDFMARIQTSDHVFVVSTQTWHEKMQRDASGVKYETKQILERLKKTQH